jgi:hypothetical protein
MDVIGINDGVKLWRSKIKTCLAIDFQTIHYVKDFVFGKLVLILAWAEFMIGFKGL